MVAGQQTWLKFFAQNLNGYMILTNFQYFCLKDLVSKNRCNILLRFVNQDKLKFLLGFSIRISSPRKNV